MAKLQNYGLIMLFMFPLLTFFIKNVESEIAVWGHKRAFANIVFFNYFQKSSLRDKKTGKMYCLSFFILNFAPALGLRKQLIGNGVRIPDCPAAVSSISRRFKNSH